MTNEEDRPKGDEDAGGIAAKIDETARRMELSDPDADLPVADRIINRIVEIIGVSALVAMVAVIFANATSRYLLNYSFSWAEEMVQMSMPWLAMTGVFLSVRRGTMIRIDFFFQKIPARLQPTVAYAGYVVNVCVLAFMAYVSLDFVRLFGGDVALYVQLPMGVSTSALVFGTAGAAMAYLAEFYREWHQRQNRTGGLT
ncbi:MAG: TRAP transporter small permease [Litoreibacter sp.]|nr:TRAP transporter small permease [Litoreibacter sp.]